MRLWVVAEDGWVRALTEDACDDEEDGEEEGADDEQVRQRDVHLAPDCSTPRTESAVAQQGTSDLRS